MSFQTNVLRDGEWVTQTVGLMDALKPAPATAEPSRKPRSRPTDCGVLTRTVIESPRVNQILPVRLRSVQHNDIAFVGDYFVQICELCNDDRLQHVIRKNDFGARIRNARVLGSLPDLNFDIDMTGTSEGDSDNSVRPTHRTLPPQMLVVVLEGGDIVFLFVERTPEGGLEFRSSRVECKPRTKDGHPGFHMAIDPDSRYLTLGSLDGLVVVFKLESIDTMREQYANGQDITPIVESQQSPISKHLGSSGVTTLHKMEFLYPQLDDKKHTILLIIYIQNDTTKMAVYDWVLGNDLTQIFVQEPRGHRLPADHRLPLLLVPVTVLSAFILISRGAVAVCKGIFGSPTFEYHTLEYSNHTDVHQGRDIPLWTAWTRPFRLSAYAENNDNIYLAREDGVVTLLEFDAINVLNSRHPVEKFNCNISTAFCSVPARFCDVLIMGGDDGPGQIWSAPPRQHVSRLGTLPNWSPSLDLLITDALPSTGKANGVHPSSKPDHIFSASCRGMHGAITEHRYGLQANIGIDIPCDDLGVRSCWIFPNTSDDDLGFYILMSLPHRSAVLSLRRDLTEPELLDDVPYDQSSATLAACQLSRSMAAQVSEKSLTLVTQAQSARHLFKEIIPGSPGSISTAAIDGDLVAVATHADPQATVHLLRLQDLAVSVVKSFVFEGVVTCLSIATIADGKFLVVGEWRSSKPYIILHAVNDRPGYSNTPVEICLSAAPMAHPPSQSCLDPTSSATISPIEAPTSIVMTGNDMGSPILVVGTRSGDVVTIQSGESISMFSEKLGATASYVYPSRLPASHSVFACCDSKLFLLSGYNHRGSGRFQHKHEVLPVDTTDPTFRIPSADASVVSVIKSDFSINGSPYALEYLITTTSRLLLIDLQLQPQNVPRNMPVRGSPSKVIYSKGLNCLVVATGRQDGATIIFMDANTGEDISCATDKNHNTVEFISGLGPGERITALYEWLYTNEGHIWRFFVVGTHSGKLLIISAVADDDGDQKTRRIKYWTRYKTKYETGPVTAIIGSPDGLFFSSGLEVHWQWLDSSSKKMVEVGKYDIDTPAVSLKLFNKKLYILESKRSVTIVEYSKASPEKLKFLHADSLTREASHLVQVGGPDREERMEQVVVVADRECGITGMTVPWSKPGDVLDVVFEAELMNSIRRFGVGHTRPYWQRLDRTIKYGVIPSTPNADDLLGICMDGSLIHFTLIDMDLCRLLRFIQDKAEKSALICPYREHESFSYDYNHPTAETFQRHIDGDILARCAEKRALEGLVHAGDHAAMTKFQTALESLEGGRWTMGLDRDQDRPKYFELAYNVLEYLFAPVF